MTLKVFFYSCKYKSSKEGGKYMKKIIVLILGVFLLSGCMTSRFDISKPLASQNKDAKLCWDGNIDYQNKISISLKPYNFSNGVSVMLVGSNLPTKYLYKGEKAFYVEVSLRPNVEGFTFDPSQMILKTDSFTLTPSAVFGPLVNRELYQTGLFHFEESKQYLFKSNTDLPTLSGTMSLDANKWNGVLLKFDTYPPVPESRFVISIKGLSNSGDSVETDVDFTKGSLWLVDDL
jgi:hypothetical protein